jgi:hypothetical protein
MVVLKTRRAPDEAMPSHNVSALIRCSDNLIDDGGRYFVAAGVECGKAANPGTSVASIAGYSFGA